MTLTLSFKNTIDNTSGYSPFVICEKFSKSVKHYTFFVRGCPISHFCCSRFHSTSRSELHSAPLFKSELHSTLPSSWSSIPLSLPELLLQTEIPEADDRVAKSNGGDIRGTWLQLMCCALPKCLCP